MSTQQPTIIYTLTDEAPLLATSSFLPIVRAFAAPAGIHVTTSDISVAARVLGEFPECLSEAQRVPDNLAELGRICDHVAFIEHGRTVRQDNVAAITDRGTILDTDPELFDRMFAITISRFHEQVVSLLDSFWSEHQWIIWPSQIP